MKATEALTHRLFTALADQKSVDVFIDGIDFPLRARDATSSEGVLKITTDQFEWHVRESRLLALNWES
ncbi:hypothetical protein [Sphingomonas sp. PP-CE-1G-424]|uniref:hypothetical protein n=1 Tax=Sphingomonas sp. PP-CE-1G-424 TaxID=2135658 RepID=UPI0010545605|nr:hypothetical protein [Sphingomonas sp. PP-CE-1G-424]